MATATASNPRFRNDLVADPVDENGERFIDVIDPDTGLEFRFYEVEYSLACAMDGERDVAGLVTWAQEELGITPSPTELASVIATLGDLGYLEMGPPSTTAGDDLGLEAGVVAPPVAPPSPTMDLELGAPGGDFASEHDQVTRVDDMPLGAAGAGRPAQPSAALTQTLGGLGAAGPSPRTPSQPVGGLDVDLSADLAINTADVKEAVRASKVMKAAELPPELAAALESSADEPPPPIARPTFPSPPVRDLPPPLVEPPRPIDAPIARPVDPPRPVEIPRPAKQPSKAPIDLGNVPPTGKHAAPAVDPGGRGVSPVLIVLLVLVILGAGGFAFWKYYWVPKHAKKESTAPAAPPPTTVAKPPEPPPPPPAPTSSITLVTPPAVEIQSTIEGPIASIAADAALITQGDEIAKIGGSDKLTNEWRSAKRDVDRVQGQIDKMTEQRAKASGKSAEKLDGDIAKRTGDLDKKKATLEALQTELNKFAILAPISGTVAVKAEKGKKVAANDVIATIQPDKIAIAQFTTNPGQAFSIDQEVSLELDGGEKKSLACKVTEVNGPKLIVACGADAPDGGKVTLK
jgi:hypothetical protein